MSKEINHRAAARDKRAFNKPNHLGASPYDSAWNRGAPDLPVCPSLGLLLDDQWAGHRFAVQLQSPFMEGINKALVI